jgi:hypothetical protein
MFLLNMFIQFTAVGIGIYISFAHSFWKGVLLVIIVLVMQAIITQISNFLMLLHQLTMSKKEKDKSIFLMKIGSKEGIHPLWKVIANICGVFFFISASYVIYLFIFILEKDFTIF